MTTPLTAETDPFPPPAVPLSVPSFDAAAFRRTLAGLTDPDYSAGDDNAAEAEYRQHAIDLCVLLCYAFGDKSRGGPLKRITLWDRIESALRTSTSKVSGGDTDLFLSLCLEHVFAVGYRTQHVYLGLLHLQAKPSAWRQGWVRYIARHVPAIVGHATLAWEREKAANADAKIIERGYGTLSTGEILEQTKEGE